MLFSRSTIKKYNKLGSLKHGKHIFSQASRVGVWNQGNIRVDSDCRFYRRICPSFFSYFWKLSAIPNIPWFKNATSISASISTWCSPLLVFTQSCLCGCLHFPLLKRTSYRITHNKWIMSVKNLYPNRSHHGVLSKQEVLGDVILPSTVVRQITQNHHWCSANNSTLAKMSAWNIWSNKFVFEAQKDKDKWF